MTDKKKKQKLRAEERMSSQLAALEKSLAPELIDGILGPDAQELPEAKCENTGWRWECPICETWNDIPSPKDTDYCSYCGKEVKLIVGELK